MLKELDREPTVKELNKALDSLAPGKRPGKNCIPAEILKCYKSHIHPPQTAQDSLSVLKGKQSATRHEEHQYSVSLHKNKDDRRDCNNYHDISLSVLLGTTDEAPSTCTHRESLPLITCNE